MCHETKSLPFSSNTFDFEKLAMLNVKDGVLMIQHDLSPDSSVPNALRFLYYKLKADDLEHATTFKLSQTKEPFALILNTFLRSQKLVRYVLLETQSLSLSFYM